MMTEKQMEVIAKYMYYICLYFVGRNFANKFKAEYIEAKGDLND